MPIQYGWIFTGINTFKTFEYDYMSMFDRILVPTDGSAPCKPAMKAAIELAEAFGSDVHVLHVINSWQYDTSIESAIEPLRVEGQEYVARLVEIASEADVPVITAVEVGRPAHRILTYVDEHDVELVVMGTRGQGGLPRRLLGSVTGYVVTHATVPVHVVPASGGDG